MDLVTNVYKITSNFPREEQFALTQQLRRCAVSIPSNIAEGEARKSAQAFGHFLQIAKGSVAELQTQLLLAERLAYLDREELTRLLESSDEVGRMIYGLIRSKKVLQD